MGKTTFVINDQTYNSSALRFNSFVLAIAVDQNTHKVYVLTHGTLSVLDSTTDKVIANVEVGKFARAIAVDHNTHKVYVVNGANIVSVIDLKTSNISIRPNITG